ncbi:MAG: sulfite exporter TauE/SafE family protein [Bacteroidota bacterium]|nr:MAG: permease [Candidatus Fluviicola riflensis]OGS78518.1 MAG: permease [Candidatus Fluviicola riflensis]OGS84384.1 MAG: permease [Fluviicola sp. RIFCSPHIGHO2_12_FULL_43_24]OGS85573.1 MAG: permease [Fluviicola sp. RIFCSPHIGHO2_01_FULL_43_53]
MPFETILILVLIGLFAGTLSGFIGVGGGIIIVPALVYFLGLTQHQATGTSLFILTLPVVILGTMNYAKTGNLNWRYGLVIASTFVIGGYIGSKLSLKISPAIVKIIFGFIMAYVAFTMIRSGFNLYKNEE